MCMSQPTDPGSPAPPPSVASTGASALKLGGDATNDRTSGIGRLMLRLTGNGGNSQSKQGG